MNDGKPYSDPTAELVDDDYQNHVEQTREDKARQAEACGCEVVFAEPNQLLLDIDRPLGTISIAALITAFLILPEPIVESTGGLSHFVYWPSRNGNGHFVLTVKKDMDELDRILIQTLLGSDPGREIMNYGRLLATGDAKICLYQPKGVLVRGEAV